MIVIANSYEKKDMLYVETKAYRELKAIVEDQYWATLLGKPGDGKSATATHLLLHYHKQGYKPIFVSSVRQWESLISSKPGEKQVIVIDDMFGSIYLDDKKAGEWLAEIEKMEKIITERQGNTIVICTSRRHIFADVESKLYKCSCFRRTSIVDMTDETYKLQKEEKTLIFRSYTTFYDIKVEAEMLKQIGYVDSPHGFPHCVEMFCTNVFLRDIGLNFFENPEEYVQKELHNFKDNDPLKFLVLLLVLYKQNHVYQNYFAEMIESSDEEVEKLFLFTGIPLSTSYANMMKAVKSLTNTYLTKTMDGYYRFTHESLKESVSNAYICLNPNHATKLLNLQQILTQVNNPRVKLKLPEYELAEKVTNEILSGNIKSVSKCDLWRDQHFVDKWIGYITNLSVHEWSNVSSCLSKYLLSQIFFPCLSKSLIECLLYCQMNEAVIAILKSKNIQKSLCKNEKWFESLECGIVYVCCTTCDIDIIKSCLTAHRETGAHKRTLNGAIALCYAIESSDVECAQYIFDNTNTTLDRYSVRDKHLLFYRIKRALCNCPKIFESLPELTARFSDDQLYSDDQISESKLTYLQLVLTELTAEQCLQILPVMRDIGADFNRMNKQNFNAMHLICKHVRVSEYLDVLKYLVDIGVDPSQETDMGIIPLMFALENNPGIDCLKWLVSISPPNFRNKNGTNIVALVLRQLEPDQCLEILPTLRERKADLNHVNKHNMNALHIVCRKRSVCQYQDVLKYLVAIGVNPSQESNDGMLPIMFALQNDATEDCLKWLLNISLLNVEDIHVINVPLLLKYSGPGQCRDFLPILRERNADFHCMNKYNMNALHIICQKKPVSQYFDVLKYLVDIGVDPSQESIEGVIPLMFALQNDPGVDCIKWLLSLSPARHINKVGQGYFHYLLQSCCKFDCLKVYCRELLKSNEDINLQDTSGKTPIMYFVHSIDSKVEGNDVSKFLKFLGSTPMNFHLTDNDGRNVLHQIYKCPGYSMKLRTTVLAALYDFFINIVKVDSCITDKKAD